MSLFRRSAVAAVLCCVLGSTLPAQAPTHPLDGLSAGEYWAIWDALKAAGRFDSNTRIPYAGLRELPKSEVLAWRPGQPFRREARVQVVQGAKAWDAIVDLATKRVLEWRDVPAGQHMVTGDEMGMVQGLMLAHPDFQAGLKRRNIDPAWVTCFPLADGYMGRPEEMGRRIVRGECWNGYGAVNGSGPPVSGLVAVIDLTEGKVIRVIDEGVVPLGTDGGNWDVETVGARRPEMKPLVISQPQGPAFTVDGGQVTWGPWRFHLRTDMRRGLVVSLVRYLDGGRERSIMYQGSVSELFVPYQAPSERFGHTAYFDLGTYPGMFEGVNGSLEPGMDCPSNAVMFDGLVAGWRGQPRPKPRVACLFERVGGEPSWRHGLFFGEAESRARRDLVLRMITHAGNYDYIFDWTFMQDGTIKVDVGATGMMQVAAAEAKKAGKGSDRYGRYVSPNMVAVNHSHFVSYRIDLDVDGQNNSLVVERIKTERLPESNPRRSIWRAEASVARTESEGQLMSTMQAPQIWRFINPAVMGVAGDPVSYQIAVDHGAMALLDPDDWMLKRAGFVNHMLWVTPYNREELFAAGDWPTRSTGGDGLPKWTAANRPIENTDLVAWVTLGFHHVPRVEDWPVMPVAWHGFAIRANGFFAHNPAIDLPKTP